MNRIAPAALLLFFLGAPVAMADEPSDGARAGRLLLADDAERRAEGEALIAAALARGEDVKAFVGEMARAVRAWANNEHRLVETWIRQAVHGDTEAREQAVRLITAMGEKAVMRLVMEMRLRGAGQSPAQIRQTEDTPPATADKPKPPAPAPANPVVLTPHEPQVYAVKILRRTMNPVEILSFLRKEADASRVRPGADKYVVYADRAGHQRLAAKLAELTARAARQRANDAPPPQGARPAPGQAAPGQAAPGKPDKPKQAKADGTPAPEAPTTATETAGSAWMVQPLVVRVPRNVALAKQVGTWKGLDMRVIAPFVTEPPGGRNRRAGPRSAAFVGNLDAVQTWFAAAPSLPSARTAYGERVRVLTGTEGKAFIGKQIPYRRGLVKAKAPGTWRVDQDILQSGLKLRFKLTQQPTRGLHLQLDASLSEVSTPMATTTVRGPKGQSSVELDQPEWNHQSRRDQMTVPATGGGILLVMPDPGKAKDGLVLILLRVESADSPLANGNPRLPVERGRSGN